MPKFTISYNDNTAYTIVIEADNQYKAVDIFNNQVLDDLDKVISDSEHQGSDIDLVEIEEIK